MQTQHSQENPEDLSIAGKGFVTTFTLLQEPKVFSLHHFHQKKPLKTTVECCQLRIWISSTKTFNSYYDSSARSQTP